MNSGFTFANQKELSFIEPIEKKFVHIEATFKYTYYTYANFTAGQQVFIATNATNFQHVLELFSVSNPQSYSWITISNSNSLATINVTIPYTGIYYIKIRSWIQSQQGLVNLNVNGQYYVPDCIASGYAGFRHSASPGTYNYFTCKISGDTRIWLEDNSSFPGRIVAYNDDYYGSGDYSWGLASRINKNFTTRIEGDQFSSYSSYTPTGTCDYYIMCMNSNIMSYFPNLKADDAIQSAPASGVYNCISWSGGIFEDWCWPPSPYDPFYAGTPLASFDNFYSSSNRFGQPGCMTYSRTGATSSNSVVDLWALNGDYTHASVTKSGNRNPHGYDWESKPGSLMRTFHPRNALNGSSYGSVSNYYQPTSTKSAILLAESIALGHSVIENVTFTDQEKGIISKGINVLATGVIKDFENKYNSWKTTWEKPEIAMQSNPRMYAQSDEYYMLLDYCKNQGVMIWPLIFDKFGKGDFFAINALEDLTLAKNQDLLEKVKKECKQKSTTESGAAIVRFPRTIAMRYIKELLKSSNPDKSDKDNGIRYSNSFEFNIFPNPANATSVVSFALPNDSKVSVNIIDLNGRVLSVIIDEQMLNAGDYSYKLRLPTEFKGPCLIKLIIDGTVNVQKIIVQ
jgi:hypothetical protein